MKARQLVVGAVAGVVLAAATVGSAEAAPKTTEVYSSSTFLPSAFTVSRGNLGFIACATVYQVKADGTHGALPYPGCSAHVVSPAGIAYSPDGHLRATTLTVTFPTGHREVTSSIAVRSDAGDPTSSAPVSDFEYDHDPDAAATYGTTSSSPCVRDALGTDASYPGRLDSALPAVAGGTDGWYVVDRAGNTVYHLDRGGKLSVLAVLPPVKVTVSETLAAASGWPACVAGTQVAYEAAPTEVEVASDGSVYVAGLPTLQSHKHADQSVIYKIDPRSGTIRQLPQRYAGPVDLAVGSYGRLFVARLDAGTISVIKHGWSSTYVKLAGVESVETDERGRLYAVQGPRTGADAHDADVVRIG